MVKEEKDEAPFLLKLLAGCKLAIGILAILGAIILGLVGAVLLASLGTDLGAIFGIVAGAGLIGIAISAVIIGLIEMVLLTWVGGSIRRWVLLTPRGGA